LLSRTFPNLIVAGNDTYRTEQQAGAKGTSVAHGLVGWTQALGSCTPRLRLGMIDTAVDKSAPGLADSRIVAWHYRPPSAASGGSTHGTKVAHLFVGRSDRLFEGGVVPGATLYAASVEDRSAAPSVTVAGIVAGIDWLLGEDVGVVNVSLAGTDNRLLSLAVRQALGQGMVFVAAAGNNGPSGQPAFPAAYSGVIAATAIDGRMRLYGSANRGPYVAFAAPGVDLWVTGKDRQPELVSGTSFAAPFVAAAAALYRTSKNMTAAEVSAAMAKTAKPLGSGGRNPEFGWGVVQFPVACRPVTSASG
jgi:subtilisin family serine protease